MNNSLYKQILKNIAARGYSREYQDQMMSIAPGELKSHLKALAKAQDASDFGSFSSHIHSLKGSFGALGLPGYHKTAEELHLAAKLIIDPEMFHIQPTEEGLLFTEKKGSNRLFIPCQVPQELDEPIIMKKLEDFIQSGLAELYSKELLEFAGMSGE